MAFVLIEEGFIPGKSTHLTQSLATISLQRFIPLSRPRSTVVYGANLPLFRGPEKGISDETSKTAGLATATGYPGWDQQANLPVGSTSQGSSRVGVTPDLQKDQEELVKRAVEVLERQFIAYVSKTMIAYRQLFMI